MKKPRSNAEIDARYQLINNHKEELAARGYDVPALRLAIVFGIWGEELDALFNQLVETHGC